MTGFVRNASCAGLLLLAAGCAKERAAAAGGGAAAEPPPLAAEDVARPSPAAAVVAAFAAVCAEPAQRPVARAAARQGFAPVPAAAALREDEPGGAAFPPDAAAWRGPAGTGDAVLLWIPATATCELRARDVDPVVVEAEFAKLPAALEAAGASVLRLPVPAAVRPGVPRTRQMLLVSPGGGPERARVLRLGDGVARDAVALSARGVAATGGR